MADASATGFLDVDRRAAPHRGFERAPLLPSQRGLRLQEGAGRRLNGERHAPSFRRYVARESSIRAVVQCIIGLY